MSPFGLFGPPNVEKLKLKGNVRGLIKALGHKDAAIRQAAAQALVEISRARDAVEALGKMGGAQAVEPLIIILENASKDVRQAAVEALGQIGDERSVETLTAALRIGLVCQTAAGVLAEIGAPAVEPLIVALKDPLRRRNAAEVLAKIGAPAVEPLVAALKGADTAVRQTAAEALGQIGDAQAVEPLIATLKDGNKDVRRAAIGALGQIGDARAVEPLIVAFKDEIVRQAAAGALAKIGAPAVELLVAVLKDAHETVRQYAAEALGQIGDARAVEPLIATLKDGNKDMRQVVVGALGQIGDARAVEPLTGVLKDVDQSVRQAAAKALGQIGDARAVGPLIAALKDRPVRRTAAEVLAKIGTPAAVELLIAALKDEDDLVRQTAAVTLGEIGDTRAVEPLIATVSDADGDVRRGAAEALGQIGDTRAVEPLIAALKDEDQFVCRAAAEALDKLSWQPDRSETGIVYWIAKRRWDKCAEIGTPAVEPLIAVLKDKDLEKYTAVSVGAAEALGQIGDARAVEPLLVVLEDADEDVRQAAAEALKAITWQDFDQILSRWQMLFLTSDEVLREHIVADIRKFSPGRVLVVGGGRVFKEALIEQLSDLADQYKVYWGEPSLSWLCQTAEEIRTKQQKAILLSNYPRETDPPTTHFSEGFGRPTRTVKMPVGTSLNLCAATDTTTCVAVYLIGMYAIGYCENVYRSQDMYRSQVSGREHLTRFQVLVSVSDMTLPSLKIEQLTSSPYAVERQHMLQKIAKELEDNPNCPVVAYTGGILVE